MRWTEEAREKQSMLIKQWEPWKHSTGPKTDQGKGIACMNAHKHGYFSAESKALRVELYQILRESHDLLGECHL